MANVFKEIRNILVKGFHEGSHGVSPEPTVAEIAAAFDSQVHQVRHDSVYELKRLEALKTLLSGQQPTVAAHWKALSDETNGRAPQIALPVLATLTAALAVAGETLLLAPVMDGFGISEPAWQALAAGTLVVVASGLLHFALERVQAALHPQQGKTQNGPAGTIATVVLAGFALATVGALGWWRAAEMIFAGRTQGFEWAGFLTENELLTKICVTLLTLGLPFYAAAALHWGFERLRYALAWRRARRIHARVVRGLEEAKKQIEAAIEKRDHMVEVLKKRAVEWREAYLEEHALGVAIGAQRVPLWRVVLQIAAVILLIVATCAVIEVNLLTPLTNGRLLAYACITFGLGGVFAYYFLKAWERPTPRQLYRQRAVIWRVGSPLIQHAQVSAKSTLPPASPKPQRQVVTSAPAAAAAKRIPQAVASAPATTAVTRSPQAVTSTPSATTVNHQP